MDQGIHRALAPTDPGDEPTSECRYVLRGVNGEGFGRTIPVNGPICLGRSYDCDVCFDAPNLSREHARLVPEPAGVHVIDLRSTNGTYVNSLRVADAVAAPGDEVRFDQLRFLVLERPQAPRAVARGPSAADLPYRCPSLRRTLVAAMVVLGAVLLAATLGFLAFGPQP